MVEQNAVRGVHVIRLTIVHRNPVGVELGGGIRRARIEGRGFALGNFLNLAVKFGRRGLVKSYLLFHTENADSFQKTKRADGVGIGGVFRRLKTNLHVALGSEIVDLGRLGFLHDANKIGGVGQVTVMQCQADTFFVRVLIEVIHALGVE